MKPRSNRGAGKPLVVNGYSEKWLKRGFPWVYPKEVERGRAPDGTEVEIRSKGGELLGRALASKGWLAARVYRHDDGPLDQAWLDGVLDQAAQLRDQLIGPETTGYRLVNGENDGLPGIRVDWWNHFAVITLDAPGAGRLVPMIASWLDRNRRPRGVYLCYRPDPRDRVDIDKASPPPGLVSGHAPAAPVRVSERGMSILVDPDKGPDVGLYADMREVRAFLEPHWGGRRVLNTFSYTGAFSVAAGLGGAVDVVSVDLSSRYLDRAEENWAANDLDPDVHEVVCMDVFKALDRFRRTDRMFDLVILDPPSFSHSKEGIWSAKRDWPRLVAAAARVLEPGGWLLTASNQGELSPRDYTGMLQQGFKKAGRSAQRLYKGGQGPDFPAATWFPEGSYLKVSVWRLL